MSSSVAQASEQASTSSGFISDNILYIVYIGLFMYIMYQFIKGKKAKKDLQGERAVFRRPMTKSNIVFILLIIIFGAVNIYGTQYLIGAIMIILGTILALQTQDSIIVAENGIFGDGKFYPWDQVKRWGWNQDRGDLVLLLKEYGKKEENAVIHVGRQLMTEVNLKIRAFKLHKNDE